MCIYLGAPAFGRESQVLQLASSAWHVKHFTQFLMKLRGAPLIQSMLEHQLLRFLGFYEQRKNVRSK